MKNYFPMLRSKGVALKSCVAIASIGFSVGAHAALPAWVATSVTQAQEDGLDMIDLIGPAVAAIVIGFVIIKLFKRGANKI